MAGAVRANQDGALVAIIADEDTITARQARRAERADQGFLLAGVGNVDLRRKSNFLIVDAKTSARAIEEAFKEFTTREDIAVVLINQYIAEIIRGLVDSYTKPVPAVLEIPSKDRPYDPSKDSILNRVKHLLGGPGGEA